MKQFGILLASAVLSSGVAAGAMAAEMPKSAMPMFADAPAAAMTVADGPRKAKKHHKKHRRAAHATA